MKATVTIFDDNGNPMAVYVLDPLRILEDGISTKYVFGFEYNQLNFDKWNEEINKNFDIWNEEVNKKND